MLDKGLYCQIKKDYCKIVVGKLVENPEMLVIDPRSCLTCPFYQPYLRKEIFQKPGHPIIPTPDDHPDTRPTRPRIDDPFRW